MRPCYPLAPCCQGLVSIRSRAWQKPGNSLTASLNGNSLWVVALGRLSEAEVEDTVRAVLRDVLAISEDRMAAFGDETELFGALPEFDSLAVAGVLTELEDRLGILIEDDEVDGDMLATFGALTRFAVARVGV
ncbi:MAG: acyl carrier protein [Sphingomonas sp.]|nr:acyl carrier protein [Sphingomonas sp.]